MSRRARGFTLVELLVAISILAIVAVLGWRGLDGIVRARIALTENMETTRGMQLAFAQMQSDTEHLAADGSLNGRAYLQVENDRMTLVRKYYAENEPMRLQVVAYRVRDGVLIRRESAGTRDLVQLDLLWKAATSDADTAVPVMLQSGVTGMQVQGWSNGQWQAIQAPLVAVQGPAGTLAGATDGVQVVLQVQGQSAPMVKSFLVGGA
ncbi:MAG: type secretory pathway component PulJ [Massilia sp.]|jgi:general secretion pathway protein J|nr:type secretory pathway component PulJ [Massilia sp.]